jgi:sugar phosphate isomerase/epimerase
MDPSPRHPLGAHSHLFRGSPGEVAAAFRRHGLDCVQLTPAFPGLSFRQPEQVTPDRCRRAADPFREQGIAVVCLSGGTNLLDPDLDRRHRAVVRWHALIRHCRHFGTGRVAVETGSLSPPGAPGTHPANRSPAAWEELRLVVAEALRVAEGPGVSVLLKPDAGHVLACAEDALRLREELAHPLLGFVLDPANLLSGAGPDEAAARLERLGPFAPVVHAKDLRPDTGGAALPRAGRGVVDYGLFVRLLRRHQPEAPVILEHLRPEELGETRAYLQRFLADPG